MRRRGNASTTWLRPAAAQAASPQPSAASTTPRTAARRADRRNACTCVARPFGNVRRRARPWFFLFANGWFLEFLLQLIVSRNKKMRSEEHTSELQSLMRISYAVFCLKKKNKQKVDKKQ